MMAAIITNREYDSSPFEMQFSLLLLSVFAELIKSIPADIINVALNETKAGSVFFATIFGTFPLDETNGT